MLTTSSPAILSHEVSHKRNITAHVLRNADGQAVDRWSAINGIAWCCDLMFDAGDCPSVEARKDRRRRLSLAIVSHTAKPSNAFQD